MALARPYLRFHRSSFMRLAYEKVVWRGKTNIHHPYMVIINLLGKLVSKEGIGEEHLADHVDEVDAVRQQHLIKPMVITKPGVH